ncbi:DUF1236 domain-containing protein [Rhodoblastus sp.]|uniref:DUF1236 domain-containing protein n=1 Tax=Rhodoblastus sp. TaxID=1962975 RepID=UPI003F9563A9
MKNRIIGFAALAAIALAPVGAYAQGIERGAAQGADEGGRDAGPVGAVVGGAVGAATGAVGGLLGVDQRPRFHEYVRREHVRSYRLDEPVRVGAVLPESDVEYYPVPREFGPTPYRYTVVDDEPVLVDPHTHRIVQVIE